MIRKTLKNGLRVVFEKRDEMTVTIQVTVDVGSNHEKDGIRGISHFVEHMVFEGTKKRKDSKTIASEIENLGGEFNAATSNERTYYYVKILGKHFPVAVDILSDIIQNASFDKKFIEKEKKVVINEIDMVNDEPRFFQWILFEKALYPNNPMSFPVYGNKEDVKNLTRESLLDFYNKYYVPKNMVVSVVGNVKDPFKVIEKKFSSKKKSNIPKVIYKKENFSGSKSIIMKKPITQTYMVLGYPVCTIKDDDYVVLDVMRAILGKGFSGTLFEEIRNKRGLAYSLGVLNENNINFGYFAIYLNSKKKSIPLIKKIIFQEIDNLEKINDNDLKNAKSFLTGDFALNYDENHKLAEELGFYELLGNAKEFYGYLKILDKVTKKDVIRVKRKYLKNPVIAILEQKNKK